jgi:hypothetical protein
VYNPAHSREPAIRIVLKSQQAGDQPMRAHVVIDPRDTDNIVQERPLLGDDELIDRLIVERAVGARVAIRDIQHLP